MPNYPALAGVASLHTLPQELLLETARYGSREEWKALCMTHPFTRAIAEELLYESIRLQDRVTAAPVGLRLRYLRRTLLGRPPLALHIKRLRFQLPHCSDPSTITTAGLLHKKRQLEVLWQVLRRTTNLTHLGIERVTRSEMWPSLQGLNPQILPRLHHLVIDGVEIPPIWFAFPQLKSIHIGPQLRIHSKDIAVAPNPAIETVEWTRGHFGYVQCEEALRLYGGSPEPGAAALLDSFPQLTSLHFQLRVHHRRDGQLTPSVGFDEGSPTLGSFDVLLGKTNLSDHAAARISSLEVRLEDTGQVLALEWIRPINSLEAPHNATLRRFSSLTSLKLPQAALIEAFHPFTPPTTQLPRSLKILHIYHAHWEIEAWLANIATNAASFPNLYEIEVWCERDARKILVSTNGHVFESLGQKLNAVSISLKVRFQECISYYPRSCVASSTAI